MDIKKLTSLIVEPTNACNLRCSFCFVTEGMARPEGFIDWTLYKKIIDETPRLEHLVLHNWGEPLLHPKIFEMIDYASRAGVPHVVMNTNGTLLDDAKIELLVRSGLSVLRFSIDGLEDTYKNIRGVSLEVAESALLKVKARRDALKADLQLGVVFTVDEETSGEAEDFRRRWESLADHVRLQPKLIRQAREEPCPQPFGKDYGQLTVLWDGAVLPCCVDYNGELALGNARTQNVKEIWNSNAMDALRRRHLAGDLPGACAECNECQTSHAPKRFANVPLPGKRLSSMTLDQAGVAGGGNF